MRVEYQSRSATPTDEIIYHNFERLLEFRIGDIRDFSSVAAALRGAPLAQILITHSHPDHARGVPALRERWRGAAVRNLASRIGRSSPYRSTRSPLVAKRESRASSATPIAWQQRSN